MPTRLTETPINDNFEVFYRATRDRVAEALALTLRDGSLGADAADEAMARALQRWEQVCDMANPAGWVYRVGLNWARSRVRRLARRQPVDPSTLEVVHEDPDIDPELAAAIDGLSVKHRAVVVLRYLLEFSERETAETLGIPEGTVKSRLARALSALRTALEER